MEARGPFQTRAAYQSLSILDEEPAVPSSSSVFLRPTMAEPRHPERFDHVFAPWPYDRRDLRCELAATLAARVAKGVSQGLDAVRREALRPNRGSNVVAGLIAVNQAWVMENIQRILQGSPDAFIPVLWHLHDDSESVRRTVQAAATVLPRDRIQRTLIELLKSWPSRHDMLMQAIDYVNGAK
jgi:hypothetical protein